MKKQTISTIIAMGLLMAAGAAVAGTTTTLANGIQMEEIKAGDGKSPIPTDIVHVHYSGTLTNGTEFDSSYARKQPAAFPLNRVIQCWTIGLQSMKVGGKAKLTCPAPTAYGANSPSPAIPPNSTLLFTVELLGIETAPK
jgi:FKBP-type peptidyl-prolyl cis-trans isomerase FkpA